MKSKFRSRSPNSSLTSELRCATPVKYTPGFKDLVLKIVTYLCNVLRLITYCNDVLEICLCVCVWRGVCPRVCKNPEEGWDGNLPALSLKG